MTTYGQPTDLASVHADDGGLDDPSAVNALSHYHAGVCEALEELGRRAGSSDASSFFEPSWAIPERSAELDAFFSVTAITHGSMGDHRGRELALLDLTANPRVRTTKTFGTSIIVARAIQHTADTGEPVLLLTPSSGNKAIALRDAVLRAYETGLATPRTLRVAVLVPSWALPKLWDSPLSTDPAFLAANPLGVYGGAAGEHVKPLTTEAVAAVADDLFTATGFRLWYTLDPRNYMAADVVRAFYEVERMPLDDRPQWHVQAVSSAYGLLGHDFGHQLLAGASPSAAEFGYLLVQHLETPDLVTGVRFGANGYHSLPEYADNADTGLLHAVRHDPHFPEVCTDPVERLERTFYTRRPPTTPAVQDLVDRNRGDGVVVSLPECLARYGEAWTRLHRAGMTRLPRDPRDLREWSVVMATVGALTAIDRGLVPPDARMVIHGSGAYSVDEFSPPAAEAITTVWTTEDVVRMLTEAARA